MTRLMRDLYNTRTSVVWYFIPNIHEEIDFNTTLIKSMSHLKNEYLHLQPIMKQ